MKKIFKQLLWCIFVLWFKIIKIFKKPRVVLVVGKEKALLRRKLVNLLKEKDINVKTNLRPYNTWFGVVLDALDIPSAYEKVLKWIWVFFYGQIKFFKHLISYPKYVVLEGGIDEKGEAKKFIKAVGPDVIIFSGIGKEFLGDFKRLNIVIDEYKILIGYLNKKGEKLPTFIKEGDIKELTDLIIEEKDFAVFKIDDILKDLAKISRRRFILLSA